MELVGSALAAGVVAGLLTFFELDKVYTAPSAINRWAMVRLSAWWWALVLANFLLAAILYCALDEPGTLKSINPWLRGCVVGSCYSALIRAKLTTVSIGGKATPLGLETLYDGLMTFVRKRINAIIHQSRAEEIERLCKEDVSVLRGRCKTLIAADSLMDEEQRKKTLTWIDTISGSSKYDDELRRLYFAVFLATGGEMRPRV